ncbi:MAG TPA: metal-dependent hydrolase [Candidatus Angelobacter sp.]|nr:metal-dependent hydrolase [Candidatus Angelobacter sp.]
MASVFTHAFVGTALGQTVTGEWRHDWRFWSLLVGSSVLPDIDALGLRVGIPYGALWGHRGMTHSLLFAAILAGGLSLAFGKVFRPRWKLALLLFAATASHGALDAMTTGGLGIAFFSPFDQHRYFFPWRPIRVSPIRPGAFLGERGIRIIANELVWVWFPTLAFLILIKAAQVWRRPQASLNGSLAAPSSPPDVEP